MSHEDMMDDRFSGEKGELPFRPEELLTEKKCRTVGKYCRIYTWHRYLALQYYACCEQDNDINWEDTSDKHYKGFRPGTVWIFTVIHFG